MKSSLERKKIKQEGKKKFNPHKGQKQKLDAISHTKRYRITKKWCLRN